MARYVSRCSNNQFDCKFHANRTLDRFKERAGNDLATVLVSAICGAMRGVKQLSNTNVDKFSISPTPAKIFLFSQAFPRRTVSGTLAAAPLFARPCLRLLGASTRAREKGGSVGYPVKRKTPPAPKRPVYSDPPRAGRIGGELRHGHERVCLHFAAIGLSASVPALFAHARRTMGTPMRLLTSTKIPRPETQILSVAKSKQTLLPYHLDRRPCVRPCLASVNSPHSQPLIHASNPPRQFRERCSRAK